MDEGENPTEGLQREVQEEIGVKVTIGEVLATDVFINLSNKKNYLVVFRVSLIDADAPFVLQESEVAEARWFAPEEIAAVPFLYAPHKHIAELFAVQNS